jgi:CBS domain-containing protein
MAQIATVSDEGAIPRVRDVLAQKGRDVVTVGPEQSVLVAAKVFAKHSVGSLLVVDDQRRIVGILAERDVMRGLARDFEGLARMKVADLMTRRVIVGLEEDTLDSVMALMTERRIRHLPIAADGKLAGVLSIGDIVKAKVHHAEAVVRYLTDYITGQYPS